MTNIQEYIVTLIKSSITNEKLILPENINIEDVYDISVKHNIIPLIFYGAINCGINSNEPTMLNMFNKTCESLVVCQRQDYCVEKILETFEASKVDYMPLKGILLRKLYQKPEMRIMGDADILIKPEQYDIIKPIMDSLGYIERIESDHEYCWYKNEIHIELHKRLIPSYDRHYYGYFGDGWRLAKLENSGNTRYVMNKEDNMIYLISHFAKHYRNAGIGIRHIVDLWVYRNTYIDLDEKYIEDELKKLNLYEFYLNILKTIECWFENGEINEKVKHITDVIFNSGVYGTYESHTLSSVLRVSNKKNGRFLKLLRDIFWPFKHMKELYPILKKLPFLLPIMWLVRIIKILFFRTDKIKQRTLEFKNTTNDKVEKYSQALKFVGLDFEE